MQQRRFGLRVMLAAIVVTAFSVTLLPQASATAATHDAPTISPGGRLLPGYYVTPGVRNVDYSKGVLQLHYFGSVYSFDDAMDFYRFAARIPSSTKPGTYRIWATQAGGTVAETYAYVNGLDADITPSSWWLQAGETVRFSGNGFRPGEPVRLYVNGVNTGTSVNAGGGLPFYYDVQGLLPGYFPYPAPDAALKYTVPSSLKGTTIAFEARGAWSGVRDSVYVSVAG